MINGKIYVYKLKKFVCRHNIIMRDTDTLKFIIDNEIYKSSTKYPTKFIIDIPEALHNFKEYFDEYKEYFNAFPVNSLFLFQNHPFPLESEISCFARLIDDCMYALNSNIEIYPIYDYSLPQKEYDNFIKRVTYYFTMRKSGSIHEIIREKRAGGDPPNFYTELKIQYPEFNKQIIEVTRAEVKKKEKIWSYGIR